MVQTQYIHRFTTKRRTLLSVLFALLFAVQTASLVHDHDSEHHRVNSCDFCVQGSILSHVHSVTAPDFGWLSLGDSVSSPKLPEPKIFLPIYLISARGPPGLMS
ncbi:hypothetical protein [Teredinibacter sp. KSP-S5-2]|uniref:hypothetical protein n=1 Tax=Teredinibacter sp. KSP-S5-2 TaxID=3034506 RepID=UPI002935332A|nr:hypothetical protein [Teredinibacter sp. KSP-S5-2]WNO11575.1 hypothetical protein P5V12_10370 [Teredinibacter sp. KSP-S5-2]